MSEKNLIGKGTFGKVRREGDLAIKEFVKPSHYVREYALGRILNHPNIISFRDQVDHNCTEIAMNIYSMSLREWIANNNIIDRAVDEQYNSECKFILQELLNALNYLHKNKIVHADVKPGNILLNMDRDDQVTKVVLCDLGISSIKNYSLTRLTSPLYQDPEVMKDEYHDIYSVGIIILNMFIEKEDTKYPKGISKDEKEEIMMKSIKKYISTAIHELPSEYKTIVRSMISNRGERPNAEQCLRKMKLKVKPVEIIHRKIVIDSRLINKTVEDCFVPIPDSIPVPRARLGSYAMDRYLKRHRVNVSHSDRTFNFYMIACYYLLDSMYGKVKKEDQLDMNKVVKYANKLMSDNQFLVDITTPSSMLKVAE